MSCHPSRPVQVRAHCRRRPNVLQMTCRELLERVLEQTRQRRYAYRQEGAGASPPYRLVPA